MSGAALRALAPRWRLLVSPPADGATNMAVDAALLADARCSGAATLRVYGWARPTLSLGRHERARGRFDAAALEAQGVEVVRRPTGGRALLHHREVTYSVTAPATLPMSASYAAINALLLDALRALGVAAAPAAPARRPLRPEGAACFAEPAAGELVVDGAKLVGSAQLREEGALLQHGSILLADDQWRIDLLRRHQPDAGHDAGRDTDRAGGDDALPRAAAAATLESLLGRSVPPEEVAAALAAALGRALGAEPEPAALDTPSLRDDLARLVIAFADPSWTWRR